MSLMLTAFTSRWRIEPRFPLLVLSVSLLLGLNVLASSASRIASQATTGADDLIKPGLPVARTLNGGETHSFKIPVAAGQFLNLRIIHRGINLSATLTDVNGKELVEMDNVSGVHGSMYLSAISETSGEFTLKLRSKEAWANSGQYEAAILELRISTPGDRRRVDVERAFARGQRLSKQGTDEARRQALQQYDEVLDFWQTKNPYWEIAALYSIGASYRRLGQLKEASIYFDRSLAEDLVSKLEEHDWRLKAAILNDRGLNNADLGKYQEAIKSGTDSLELFRAHQDQRGQASALNGLGYTYTWMGRYEEALQNYNESIAFRKAEKDHAGEYNVVNNIAYVRSLQGHSELAVNTYQEVIKNVEANQVELKEPDQLAAFYQNVALVYDNLGDSQQAQNWYKQAWDKLKNQKGRTALVILDNTGELYAALGEPETAMTHYANAMALFAENNRDTNRVFDPEKEASVRTHIGQIHLLKNEVAEAVAQFEKAVALRQSPRTKADALINLGAAYAQQQNPQKALDYYDQARKLLERSKDDRILATLLLKRSEAYDVLGNDALARTDLDQALSLWNKIKDRRGAATALQGIARLEQKAGHLDEAVRSNTSALEIIESLRTKIANIRLRTSYFATQQAYYELNIALNLNLYQRDGSQKYLEAALEASEKSRARSLMDSLDEVRSDLRQGVSEELLKAKQELERRLNAAEGTQISLMNRTHSEEQRSAIEETVKDLNREIEDVDAQIITRSPKYAALIRPRPQTLKEIQQQLDTDTLLLEYSLGEQRSYVWAVVPDSINGFELPARREIEAIVEQLTSALAKRNREVRNESADQWRVRINQADTEFGNASAALSKMVIDPVASLLGNRRLVIVADGALQVVSFGALPQPKTASAPDAVAARNRTSARNLNPQVLLENHEIVYEPSASVLALQRRELENRKQAPNAVAVLANPVFDKDDPRARAAIAQAGGQPATAKPEVASLRNPTEGNRNRKDLTRALDDLGISRFRPLPSSKTEAEGIRNFAPKTGVIAKLDFDANRATAMSKELSNYRIVHFATHGVVDYQHPELSGIVLSMVDKRGKDLDGYLRLHDIYNLNLPAELVVLSACQTGLGKQIKGEGLIALTRGFMYAGAPRVVASLWQVDDKATAELMTEFYKQMFAFGLRPAAALREAQITLSRRPSRRPPYFWAGFVLQGEWR